MCFPKHAPKANIVADSCYCGSCDRGFASEEDYLTHCAGHVTCGLDGCTISADPKVIDKHVRLQHKTGLYKRVVSENPHDIQKWIEERKRKFPTKRNVQENKEKFEEMEKRGERLQKENDRFGKRKRGNQTGNQPTKTRKIEQDGNAEKKQRQKIPKNFFEEEPEQEHSWRGGLPHFPGTALFPAIKDEDDEDDEEDSKVNIKLEKDFSDHEWEDDAKESINTSTTALPAALLSICDYNSESESDREDESVTKPDVNDSSKIIDKSCQSDRPCSPQKKFNFSIETNEEDYESPEEVKIQKTPSLIGNVSESETSTPANMEQETDDSEKNVKPKEEISENGDEKVDKDKLKESRKRVRNHKKPDKKPTQGAVTRSRRRLTLLEKLLGPEIRHERNVILQCVCYVVENNFFDKQ